MFGLEVKRKLDSRSASPMDLVSNSETDSQNFSSPIKNAVHTPALNAMEELELGIAAPPPRPPKSLEPVKDVSLPPPADTARPQSLLSTTDRINTFALHNATYKNGAHYAARPDRWAPLDGQDPVGDRWIRSEDDGGASVSSGVTKDDRPDEIRMCSSSFKSRECVNR